MCLPGGVPVPFLCGSGCELEADTTICCNCCCCCCCCWFCWCCCCSAAAADDDELRWRRPLPLPPLVELGPRSWASARLIAFCKRICRCCSAVKRHFSHAHDWYGQYCLWPRSTILEPWLRPTILQLLKHNFRISLLHKEKIENIKKYKTYILRNLTLVYRVFPFLPSSIQLQFNSLTQC